MGGAETQPRASNKRPRGSHAGQPRCGPTRSAGRTRRRAPAPATARQGRSRCGRCPPDLCTYHGPRCSLKGAPERVSRTIGMMSAPAQVEAEDVNWRQRRAPQQAKRPKSYAEFGGRAANLMRAGGGGRGPGLAWQFPPAFPCINCLGSNGSCLPIALLADRGLSPQVRPAARERLELRRHRALEAEEQRPRRGDGLQARRLRGLHRLAAQAGAPPPRLLSPCWCEPR